MKNLRRGKWLLLAAGLLLLSGVYYSLLISPALSSHRRLEQTLVKREKDMEVMQRLRAEWEAFVAAREQAEILLAERGDAFSLLSFMEAVTRKAGLEGRISHMKPLSFSEEAESPQKPVGIEIQLDGLRMNDLVRLLHETEYSGKLLRVRRIKITAGSNDTARDLKVTLQVQTFTRGAS